MEPYLGEIRLFAGDFAPVGWLTCNGALLQVADYEALAALLGDTYGGDGVTTFALPDLRGRLPIGAGQGAGLKTYTLGQAGGTESVVLAENQLPAHSHGLTASRGQASSAKPGVNFTLATVSGSLRVYVDTSQGKVTGTSLLNPAVIDTAGGGLAHDNVMPCAALTYIISTDGNYPSAGATAS